MGIATNTNPLLHWRNCVLTHRTLNRELIKTFLIVGVERAPEAADLPLQDELDRCFHKVQKLAKRMLPILLDYYSLYPEMLNFIDRGLAAHYSNDLRFRALFFPRLGLLQQKFDHYRDRVILLTNRVCDLAADKSFWLSSENRMLEENGR
jgi:hypothetical protein